MPVLDPGGKQVLNPKDIYYTPSSGIWQTVWLEKVSAAYIQDLQFTPQLSGASLDKGQLAIQSKVQGDCKGCTIEAVVPGFPGTATLKPIQGGNYAGRVGNRPAKIMVTG